MVSPYRPLPPLGTLRTFEAVARHLSFTLAAADLALPQSAVSHQIRALEEHLGARLFHRHHRAVEMTREGRTFLEVVRAGLDSILLASERIRNQRRVAVLTVASPAAFAIWWLVPRLGRFAALYPEIEVRIATIDGREPDLLRDGIDVAVVKRPAKAAARNPLEMPLLSEVVFPVCAPSLLNAGAPLRSPTELAKYALIECDGAEAEHREFGWSTWLPRLGLDAVPPPRRLHFSQFGPALSAAVDGLGIALGRSPMVDTELAAGRLVRPLPKRVVAKASQVFALTWRDAGAVRNDQRIAAFRNFALDEACGCELAAGPCGMPPSERDIQMRAVWMGGRATRRTMTPATARDQGSAYQQSRQRQIWEGNVNNPIRVIDWFRVPTVVQARLQ